jgi:hypothetical protein
VVRVVGSVGLLALVRWRRVAVGRGAAWVSWVVLLAVAAALAVPGGDAGSGGSDGGAARINNADGRAVPAAALATISHALGAGDRAYWVVRGPAGYAAESPGQRLSARFGPKGVDVRSGLAWLRWRLEGYGSGRQFHRIAPVAPRAHRNRVVYARAGLTEWYVNGPLGLEQGSRSRGSQPRPGAD